MPCWHQQGFLNTVEKSKFMNGDCKLMEQSIPLFLEGKIPKDKGVNFFEHLKKCPDCMEELEINFLLTEGIRRAENGETFNLKTDLEKLVTRAELKAERYDRIKKYLISSGVVLLFLALAALYFVFLR